MGGGGRGRSGGVHGRLDILLLMYRMPTGWGPAPVGMHVVGAHVTPGRGRGLWHVTVAPVGVLVVMRVVLLLEVVLMMLRLMLSLLRLLLGMGLGLAVVLRGVVGRGSDGGPGRHLALRSGCARVAVHAAHGRVVGWG